LYQLSVAFRTKQSHLHTLVDVVASAVVVVTSVGVAVVVVVVVVAIVVVVVGVDVVVDVVVVGIGVVVDVVAVDVDVVVVGIGVVVDVVAVDVDVVVVGVDVVVDVDVVVELDALAQVSGGIVPVLLTLAMSICVDRPLMNEAERQNCFLILRLNNFHRAIYTSENLKRPYIHVF